MKSGVHHHPLHPVEGAVFIDSVSPEAEFTLTLALP
jgi:hypothetical protein